MNISEQIRNYRKSVGLTQEQVANALGVSASAVNKWEKGNSYPDISTLPALARLLQMSFLKQYWKRVSIRCLKWHQRKYMNIHGASC